MPTRQFLCDHDEKGAGAPPLARPPGTWRRDSQDLLRRLAQTMPPAADRSLTNTSSVPDIWGYATFFAAAWADENHPLNRESVAAWRGLLTLVALKEIAGLPVTLYPLTDQREGSQFLAAAFLNPPKQLFEPLANTMPLGAVLFRDRGAPRDSVAGLLVPSLLVLPGRDFRLSENRRIGWRVRPEAGVFPLGDPVDRSIGNPAAPPRLKPNQLDGLIVFLNHLEQGVNEQAAANRGSQALSTLLNRLASFRTDAERARESGPRSSGIRYEIGTSDERDGRRARGALATDPLRMLLDRPKRLPSDGQAHETDIALPFRAGLADRVGSLPTPILYAEDLDEAICDRRLGELRVLDDLFVSETNERDIVEREAWLRERNHLLVLPQQLFEDRLLEFGGTDASAIDKYSWHGPAERFLLPFKPLILAFLSGRELVSGLRLVEDEDSVTVAVRVRLHSPRGEVTTEIRRTYRRSRDEIRRIGKNMAATSLLIWPDFQAPDWRIYLLYQSCGQEDSQPLHAHRLITEGAIVAGLNERIEEGSRALEGKIDRAAEAGANRVQLAIDPKKEVVQTDCYVLAVQAAVGADKGLLLCRQIEQSAVPPVNPGRQWRVGIDFGASNSSVAYNADPYQNPDCLVFAQDRTVLLTESRDYQRAPTNPGYAAAIYEFLSPNRVDSPFLSLIHERHPQRENRRPAPFSVNRIGYVDRPTSWLDQVCGGGASQYFFSLKWQDTPIARARVDWFIRQLVLQSCAEARAQGIDPATIDWRITVPGSLPANIAKGFEVEAAKSVSEVTRQLLGRPPAVAPGVRGPSQPHSRVAFPLESTSAFCYVIERESRALGTMQVIMDVGGWSTDIAIHPTGGGMPIWEGSLELGGQHILVEYLRGEVRTLLAYLGESRPEFASLADRIAVKPQCSNAIVEMLINDPEIGTVLLGLTDQDRDLSDAGRRLADLVEGVRKRADFALFALVDYTMLLLAGLVRDNLMAEGQRIGFVLCGRGSKLFEESRLERPGSGASRANTNDRLARLMDGNDTHPHRLSGVSFSHNAKKEVALGAVIIADPIRMEGGMTRRELPLGERLHAETLDRSAGGRAKRPLRTFEAVESLPFAEAATYTGLTCPALDQFGGFVERYNKSLQGPGISAGAASHDGVQGSLSNLIARGHSQVVRARGTPGYFQPPFILAVRAALEMWEEIRER